MLLTCHVLNALFIKKKYIYWPFFPVTQFSSIVVDLIVKPVDNQYFQCFDNHSHFLPYREHVPLWIYIIEKYGIFSVVVFKSENVFDLYQKYDGCILLYIHVQNSIWLICSLLTKLTSTQVWYIYFLFMVILHGVCPGRQWLE